MTYDIPFNRAPFVEREIEYVTAALRTGLTAGDGVYTQQCARLLKDLLEVPAALLTPSCTHALEMSAILLDVGPGDEVIVPSFTFVSTVNAFVLRGAKPVFCDVRPDTLNLDEGHLRELVTERTRVVVPVHYAGVGCEMVAICQIAESFGAHVVEDNAHGLFGRLSGQLLGTFGALATLSFHQTKNFSSGEGGALLISDSALIQRAEVIREKGTNRSRFFRGQVDKYTWVDIGSSYLMSDVLAAGLLAQLEAREVIQGHRAALWARYASALEGWASSINATLPSVPVQCEQTFHMFYLLMPDLESRTAFIEHLRIRGILAVFHYQPLHLSDMGRTFGGQPGMCPVTEDIVDRLVRLPMYFGLALDEQARVIDAVLEFRGA